MFVSLGMGPDGSLHPVANLPKESQSTAFSLHDSVQSARSVGCAE